VSRLLPALPVAALLIGTMSPDYEYLFRLEPASYFSHTVAGVFMFCVPVSMAAWLIYRWLVAPWWRRRLPPGVRARLDQARRPVDLRTVLWAAVATTVGALSHLFWDAFTHREGIVVAAIPALQRHALSPGGSIRWYQVSQHGSTALGLVLLFLWSRRTWRRFPREARQWEPGQCVRLVTTVLALVLVATVGGLLNSYRAWDGGPVPMLAFGAVGAMDAVAASLIIIGIVDRIAQPHGD